MFTRGKFQQIIPRSVWYKSTPEEQRYEELIGSHEAYVAIVGGGLAGLLTAYQLAKHGMQSVIIEGGLVAGGDSSQLAGIGTRVIDASFFDLEAMYGTDFIKRLCQSTTSAQRSLESIVSAEGIECDFAGTTSYFFSRSQCSIRLQHEWEALSRADSQVSLLSGAGAQSVDPKMRQAIKVSGESRLDPRKLCRGLLNTAAFRQYVTVFENSFVTRIDVQEHKVVISTDQGRLVADILVLASGRPHADLPELQELIKGVKVCALAAEFENNSPCPDGNFFDDVLPCHFYRRMDDKTIVFGGGDQTAESFDSKLEMDKLMDFMKTDFPGRFKVTSRWHGTIYLTADGLPLIGQVRSNVYVCSGFGGTGFWASVKAGEIITALVLGEKHPEMDLFAVNRQGLCPAPAGNEDEPVILRFPFTEPNHSPRRPLHASKVRRAA